MDSRIPLQTQAWTMEADSQINTPTEPKTLRIFISSPGDVNAERDKAKQVIAQLQKWYGSSVRLVPVLWEDLPLEINASFQDGIDVILSGDKGIDIAVFILWSRIGTPVTIGDKHYNSGTEREFDLMLQALDSSGGERPDIIFYRRDDDDGFKRRLTGEGNSAEIREMLNQSELAQSFVQEHFWDEHGQNNRAYHSFHQPVEFAGRLKVHLQGLIDKRLENFGLSREATWADAPYRGLETFDLQHADIFFGREREIVELESRLRERERAADSAETYSGHLSGNSPGPASGQMSGVQPPTAFVAVIGASGSGKSSLVRAGLRANLTRFNLDESISEWRSMVMMPAQSAGNPISHLLDCLVQPGALPELKESGIPLPEIAQNLAESPKPTVNLTIKPALLRDSRRGDNPVAPGALADEAGPTQATGLSPLPAQKLLIIIDQFEELFTDKRISGESRDAFLTTLEALAQSGLCWVVITMRSDFYPVAQKSEIFLRLKGETGQFDLLAPGPEALRRIITEPARMAGLHFERRAPELGGQSVVGKILEDAKNQPDMLPLLSDLLLELYQRRTPENLVTFAAYESLGDPAKGVTGLEGALSTRADKEFDKLTPEQQKTCPEILHALVTVEADADVRRRANLAALKDTPQKTALVDAFINARLLTADGPSVSLAHEALLRKWDRVADWVRDNRQHLRIRSRVEQAMRRWQSRNQHSSLLLPRGLELAEGLGLLRQAPHLLAGKEYDPVRDYIRRSKRRHFWRRFWLWTVILAIAGFALIVGFLGLFLVLLGIGAPSDMELKDYHEEVYEGDVQMPEPPPLLDDPQAAVRPFHRFKNRVGIEMMWCWPGTFTMGRPRDEPGRFDEEASRDVRLTRGFWMARTEVTQGQWSKLMAENPSLFRFSKRHPVERVSWNGATTFCRHLTELERSTGTIPIHWEYTLPTEAQWEYACRAGSSAPFSGPSLAEMGWYLHNAFLHTHPVGLKKSNRWGFYDMHGNVFEWCLDGYGNYDPKQTKDPFSDPRQATNRVHRGGSWINGASGCRSASRYGSGPGSRSNGALGFRPVLTQVRPQE